MRFPTEIVGSMTIERRPYFLMIFATFSNVRLRSRTQQ